MKRKAARPLYYVEVDELDEATPRQLTCVRASSIHDGNFNADRFLQEWRNNGNDREFWKRGGAVLSNATCSWCSMNTSARTGDRGLPIGASLVCAKKLSWNRNFESLKRLPLPHVLTNVQLETKILAFHTETGIGQFRFVDEECRLGFIEKYLRAQAAIMPWGHISQEWEIGDACVVRGSLEDQKLYRAVIVAILPGGCATVDYCDYTFQASEPLRELCPLIDNAVTNYPPLAFGAKMPCLTMEAQNGVAIEERLNSVGLFTNVWKTTFAIDGDGQLSASIGC
uniref:Tudor domain-containing protein n=1 Tax=Trichuris muris TaxID=70415 RepID=A0A5S6QG48_TRIMR